MSLVNERAHVLSNAHLCRNLYLMTLSAPVISHEILPGQFVHMRIPNMEGHILRRPFSVYATNAGVSTLDILYQVVGFGTDVMTELCEGEEVELIGPVGQTWRVPDGAKRAMLVGGGVGAAPLYMLCEKLIDSEISTTVILGAATSEALVCKARFDEVLARGASFDCEPVQFATDDGSSGYHGFCTPLVTEALAKAKAEGKPYDYIATCGPEPLMKLVAAASLEANTQCEVSMERRMACGIGACLSCVVETSAGKRRACVDGPIFDAKEVCW